MNEFIFYFGVISGNTGAENNNNSKAEFEFTLYDDDPDDWLIVIPNNHDPTLNHTELNPQS
ncbi:hypothetical protein DERF_004990 [Dermatophagoides farinae]|uniref:Uncharacterized protein n=1 Tax=Dermatophagoides farinae TaxID=6954 RepID=A0A922L888_DERFA|nr:hypothetical protein DERF_004990 [Dermatophagoides farinae]